MSYASTTDCRACGNIISRQAYDCPKCGEPNRKPKRGFFGWIFKWSFVAWNVLMIVLLFAGAQDANEMSQTYTTEAEQAGHAIGTGIGVVAILFVWVLGDIILGLLTLMTRPRR